MTGGSMVESGSGNLVYVVSLVLHAIAGMTLAAIKIATPPEEVQVDIINVAPPKPEKPPEPEPEPEPEVVKKAPPRAAPVPVAAPVDAAPPPDFGFALSGGSGPGGIAVAAPKAAEPQVRQATKKLSAVKAPVEDACGEPEVKAKAVSMPHPAYTEEARAAAIEGKARIELTIDPAGEITAANVISGLGYGLDEAALAAVRAAHFNPATRCGKGVASTFVVAVRFAL